MSSSVDIQILDDPRVVERIRVLDKYCFPVKYSDDYYSRTLGRFIKGDENVTWTPLNQVAFYQDMLVGSITTRIETQMDEADCGKTPLPGRARAYIMTLGVLQPYRRMGIAKQLVQKVVEYLDSGDIPEDLNVEEVGLHVQQGSSALEFYKSIGFEVRYEVKDYYTNIEPTLDAYYVSKKKTKKATTAGGGDSKKGDKNAKK